MNKTFNSYVSFLTMALIVGLSACGKKVAKTTGSSDAAPAATVSDSRTDGGTSVSSDFNTDVNGDGDVTTTDTAAYTNLRQCTKILSGATEASVAGFFFKTVVPMAERSNDPEVLDAKYWTGSGTSQKLTGLMDIEGDVTLCLTISGTQATLRVEYEDHFATTWVNIGASNTYYMANTSSTVDIIWMDAGGFISLKGPKSAAVLRFANMPSTTALNARATALKTASQGGAPIASLNQRNQCRNSALTLDQCVTNYVYSPDLWSEVAVSLRLREIIGRYVDSESAIAATHPFNTNYNKYLIKNGKLGTVNIN